METKQSQWRPLQWIDEGTEMLDERLVGTLCLAISFRVMGGGKLMLSAKGCKDRLRKFGNKARITVEHDGLGDAMKFYDVVEEELSCR